MMQAKRFHSINFILWFSFLAFAAFIIVLTWVFQTTFLQLFFNEQTKSDLESIGGEMHDDLASVSPIRKNDLIIDAYVRERQENNIAATIYLLDGEGQVLYPLIASVDSEYYDSFEKPSAEVFANALAQLSRAPENALGITVKQGDGDYLFLSEIAAPMQRSVYLYIDYSSQLTNVTMGNMRLQLIFISIIVIFLALVISGLLSIKLTKPIVRITKAAKQMAKGDFSVNFKGEYSYAEMDALAETLDYAKEEIGRSDALQKEVLANVTHDLKTPLTMINRTPA